MTENYFKLSSPKVRAGHVNIALGAHPGCFHHYGLTTIQKWDPICVALVSVISIAGLIVFITDIAMGDSNYLIFQLHFCRVTFFTAEKQIHILDNTHQMSQNLSDCAFLSKIN